MSNSKLTNNESDFGRIQVAPEILLAIAERNTHAATGVLQQTVPPSADLRRISRRLRKDGILLTMDENRVIFDIYVIMDANVNIMETSRKLQTAVIESVEQMSGVQVNAVNIHIEDVAYPVA
jgi:uncharacterized alkaline shock family protein YloU